MTDYVDVPLRILRVDSYELHTVINPNETVQLIRYAFPDGSQTPWLALTPKLYSDQIAGMQTRQLAGLEAEQRLE